MSKIWRFGPALGSTRKGLILLMLVGGLGGIGARAAVADLLPEDPPEVGPELEPTASRQADAISWFANGLFAEEQEGPEKALESYRKALELDPANVDLAIRLSYDQLRRGEITGAISLLKDAAKAAPKNPEPFLALSSIYLRHLHKPELADQYAEKALALAPERFLAYATLIEVYQARGQSAKAAKLLEQGAASKSEDPEYWISLAELAGQKLMHPGSGELTANEHDLVMGMLAQATETGDKNAVVQARIGDLYVLSGKVDRAIPAYLRAIALDSTLEGAREKLAGSYLELEKTAEAIVVIKEIIVDHPLNVAAYDQLTELQLRAENIPQALASAEQAIILVPGDPLRYDHVIRMNLKEHRSAAALAHAREALRRFPKTPVFSFFEALALSEEKKHAEAIRAFERTVVEAGNSHPDLLDGDFYFSYGAATEQAGQLEKAVELFRKSIVLDPGNSARAYNYIGYMWVEKNQNLDEAARLIGKAVELDPGNGAYIDSLGWLYFKQGKYEDALRELLRASEALPEPDAVVFEHIGDTYDKLGKEAEAVLYWQKAAQLDPDNTELTGKLDKSAKKVVGKPKP